MRPALGERIRDRLIKWTYRQGGPEVQARLEDLPQDVLNEFGIDPFGFDPEFTKAAIAPIVWLYKNYFRVEVHGVENIPPGGVFLISNHSGQIPIDAMMIGLSAFLEAEPPRVIRAMYEKWIPSLPFVSIFMQRLGQVVGTPANCKRLLDQGECILVFPEGARGIVKPIQQRYQLTEFGLGFMRIALETGTPIVPIGVVGAEEQIISIANLSRLGKVFGMPGFPVIPQLLVPILGWAPLPTKYRIYFGEPMVFDGNPDDEDAEIEKKVRQVKHRIETLLDQGLRERKSVFF
jgi:1-acyl-sn-glycerol-3-phosphate acyltransferase